ncbi:cAMP phosphodiesterase [Microbacter margulisiae]|uniref:cAMP phosphodiesterase n=1 Tax=Microbacter margulisiae TaxID=1350067 RepID=A0A7W5H1B2_9PORP|nr:cAMP phosphodiesterase [Microbacter margulisiae]
MIFNCFFQEGDLKQNKQPYERLYVTLPDTIDVLKLRFKHHLVWPFN